jgi:signal transduction histidine kinase
MGSMRTALIVLSAIGTWLSCGAIEVPSYDFGRELHSVSVKQALVHFDSSGGESLGAIRNSDKWQSREELNFGYSKDVVWLHFRVRNTEYIQQRVMLEHGYPLIQSVRLYVMVGETVREMFNEGRLLPFAQRPIAHRNFIFPLVMHEYETLDLYMRLETTGTLRAPLKLHSSEGLSESTANQSLGLGIYYGTIIALTLYNLFLFLSTRDTSYLYYVLYSACFAALQSSLNGISFQYLWPEWVAWNNITVPVFVGGTLFFLSLFTASFLKTASTAPKMHLFLRCIAAIFLAVSVFGAIRYGRFANQLAGLVTTFCPLLFIPPAIIRLRSGFRPAVYYLLAFAVFFVGTAAVALKDFGLLPMNFFTIYGNHIGAAFEVLLFSLGLAHRLKSLKEESMSAELRALASAQKLKETEAVIEQKQSLTKLAEQVAHDIRSPLSALYMVTTQATGLPEEDRLIMRSAVEGINDIVNNLDASGGGGKSLDGKNVPIEAETQLASSIISSIVSEKRAQYRNRPDIIVSAKLGVGSYGQFVHVDANKLRRILSNLINNAVEALDSNGSVTVTQEVDGQMVLINVMDDGKGIPESILPMIGTRGFSFGKVGGTGLGLHNAKEILGQWGGTIAVESKPGRGTKVTIGLRLAKPPQWYVPVVLLHKQMRVVVLDDDESIHHVWRRRFSEIATGASPIEVMSCQSADQLEGWVQRNGKNDTVFLIDFELIRQGRTGLEMVEALGIAENSILVTSRYSELELQERCAKIDLRIIPKTLASIVPIRIQPRAEQNRRFVLVDDDVRIQALWKAEARRVGKDLVVYGSPDELLSEIETFNCESTWIYIDSNLRADMSGEELCRIVRQMGFEKVFIASGYSEERFKDIWWITGATGKFPPFTDLGDKTAKLGA